MLGNVLSGGGNIARLTALQTGLFPGMPGLTVDRQCGSGINAINLAAQAIWAMQKALLAMHSDAIIIRFIVVCVEISFVVLSVL